MADAKRPRLTARQGRRFGLTLGVALLTLAAFWWWRDRALVAGALAAFGGALIVGGLAIPSRLGPFERAWMSLAYALSRVTTPVLMAALYFGLITPIGSLRRLMGQNPIVQRETATGYWKPRAVQKDSRSRLERQF